MRYRLGVDLGTTYTAAALNIDGQVEMLSLGNRATQVASVVFLKEDGTELIGEPAEYRGAADPNRLAREFKRRIGGVVPIIIGGSPYSPQSLLARVLGWTVEVAARQQGAPPEHVCVTYPANWGPFKQEILEQVLKLAGQRGASVCTEPEAAAIAYASRDRVPDGARLAVYDLGGGTFDAAVLIRHGGGFRLIGTPDGVEHLGGIDFDAAVIQHVLDELGPAVQELDDTDQATLLGLNRLRRDCVAAKEALSTDDDTVIPVALPGLSTFVPVTRAQFEEMVRPAIQETIAAMQRALASAGVTPDELHAIVMVGGSSRIPLVGRMLRETFGRPLALDNHPKHDVALGAAIRAHRGASSVVPEPAMVPAVVERRAIAGPPTGPQAGPSAGQATTVVARAGVHRPPAGAPGFRAPQGRNVAAGAARPGPGASAGVSAASAARPAPRPPAAPPPRPHRTGHAGNAGQPPDRNRQPATAVGHRWVMIGAVGVVVLLAVVLGVVAGLRRLGPVEPELPTEPSATAAPSPSAVVATLPESAQPLPDDVILWPVLKDGNWDIGTITSAGVTGPPLISSPEEDTVPVISRNRRTILYLHATAPGVREVRAAGADGSGDRPLFDPVPNGCGNVTRPAFGDQPEPRIVLPCIDPATGEVTLKLVRLDGTVVRDLDRGWLSDPALSPAGSTVVYWQDNATRGEGGAIYQVPVDGSAAPKPITGSEGLRDNDAAASPGGGLIAITRAGAGIWTVGFDGNPAPTQLTTGPSDMDPSWSPDGTQIVFKRRDEMWLMNADGSNVRRLSQVGEVGTAPAWSPR